MTHLPDEERTGERQKGKGERGYGSKLLVRTSEASASTTWRGFLKKYDAYDAMTQVFVFCLKTHFGMNLSGRDLSGFATEGSEFTVKSSSFCRRADMTRRS
jgi:hypothetical protein